MTTDTITIKPSDTPTRWVATDICFLTPDDMHEGIGRLKRAGINAQQLPGHVDPCDDKTRWTLAWAATGGQWGTLDNFSHFVRGLLDDIGEPYEHGEVNNAQLVQWLASTTLSEDRGA